MDGELTYQAWAMNCENELPKLLPCPFCGGEAKAANEEYVSCLECGALLTGANAIKRWNTRAERTCKNIASTDDIENEFVCSVCGYTVPMFEYGPEIGEHCKGCGGEVIA